MAELAQLSTGVTDREEEIRSFADRSSTDADLEDLIHSWRRLGNPGLRRLAVRLVRMLGEDQPEPRVGHEMI